MEVGKIYLINIKNRKSRYIGEYLGSAASSDGYEGVTGDLEIFKIESYDRGRGSGWGDWDDSQLRYFNKSNIEVIELSKEETDPLLPAGYFIMNKGMSEW